MIINSDQAILNATMAAGGSTAPANSRQTGNWMAALEQAFLAEQPAPQETPGQGGDSGNAASDSALLNSSPAPVPAQFQAQSETEGPSPTQTQAASSTPGQITQQASSAKTTGQENANAAESADSQPMTSTAGKIEATPKTGQTTMRSAPEKTKGPIAITTAPVAATLTHAAQATANGDGVAQQLAQFQAAVEMSSSESSATVISGVTRALPVIPMPLAMSDSVAGKPQSNVESEQPTLEQTPETSSEGHQASTAEPYPLRQMHMIQTDSGVSAWIRDAGLSQPQAYSVAQALSSELTNSGLKLNALVLNGKKLAGLFQGNKYQEHEVLSIDHATTVDASHSNITAKPPVNKGVDEKGAI
jgi:hypothetical protein